MRTLPGFFSAAAAATAALFLLPAAAGAQPSSPPPSGGGGGGTYQQPPEKPAFHQRFGLTLGFSFGLGGMTAESGPIECIDCDYDPIAVGFHGHLGGMINPRLAIQGELAMTGQTLDAFSSAFLYQSMFLGVLKYWLHPMVWIKGGLGFSSVGISYDDGGPDERIDSGLGIMGAAGFELFSSPRFAIDVRLRLASGSYDGIDDQIHTGTLGVGFSWY